jgi:flavin-dependent dehydrogenase
MPAALLDLVIVGGGPAGISTALFLQRHAPHVAARTVVLEKERYPREKYCAGAIGARALRQLESIGVGAAAEVPAVQIHAISMGIRDRVVTAREPDLGIVIRRIEFDHALARTALARGLEVREGAAVASVEPLADRVRVTLESGEILEARAIVGADGVGGIVRRACGFPRGELRAQVVELDTGPGEGDPAADTLHFDFRYEGLHGYVWDFPTIVGGRAMMCRGAYFIRGNGHHDDVRARIADHLRARGLDPDLSRYKLKPFAERGFEPGAPISAPRVLLAGESAGIDIATGEGIAQAIAYGALAGRYLADAFRTGDFSFADWLATVEDADEGRRLLLRHFAFRWMFGPERPTVERLLRGAPALVSLAAQGFAGHPHPPGVWPRAAAQIAPLFFRLGPGVLLRKLRARASRA